MPRYLKLLQPADVYIKHDLTSPKFKTLSADLVIPYTREKRREKINWMEIILPDGSLAYLRKYSDNLFLCERVALSDESSTGFGFTYKTPERPPMSNLFWPEGSFNEQATETGKIDVRRIEGGDNGKTMYVKLNYQADLIDVTPIRYEKNEEFYIIFNPLSRKDVFMEVDDLQGRRGFLLKKTGTSTREDQWLQPVAIIIMIVTIIAIILGFLANGWLVISTLMIIPAIIVALVVIVAVQISILIIKGIIHQIYKRF
jgi:hypothetical protein